MTEQATKLAEAVSKMPEAAPKDCKNAFFGWSYASADSLYRTIRPAMSEAGFLPWQDEVSMEIIEGENADGEKMRWIKATYALAITPDGTAPSADQCERVTVMCQLNDTQSFQALRTYALKYYLRGKTLTATGELDVDATAGDAPPTTTPQTKAPAAPAGKWVLNQGTMEFQRHGEFPDELTMQRALMKVLLAAFLPGSNIETAGRIYLKNGPLITEILPTAGQEMIVQRFNALADPPVEKEPQT